VDAVNWSLVHKTIGITVKHDDIDLRFQIIVWTSQQQQFRNRESICVEKSLALSQKEKQKSLAYHLEVWMVCGPAWFCNFVQKHNNITVPRKKEIKELKWFLIFYERWFHGVEVNCSPIFIFIGISFLSAYDQYILVLEVLNYNLDRHNLLK
jgi:hypothetical protein